MATERDTRTITTTGGHVVVFKAYLTGGETNNIRAELFKGVSTTGEASDKPRLPLSNLVPFERKQLESLLISFDGNTEQVIESFEDLPSAEYSAALTEIKKEAGLSLATAK